MGEEAAEAGATAAVAAAAEMMTLLGAIGTGEATVLMVAMAGGVSSGDYPWFEVDIDRISI